jgi:hypothetical protein
LKTKKIFFSSLKNALAYYNAGVVAVNLKIVRLVSSWVLEFQEVTNDTYADVVEGVPI